MSVSTRRLAVATLLTGIIAGLVGLACIHLLHWIQAIAWDMHGGTLLEAVSAVSPARRIGVLTLAGIVGALSWFLLFRRNKYSADYDKRATASARLDRKVRV